MSGDHVPKQTDQDLAPLRILHIGKYFPPHRGGIETFLRDLMVEQQRQGLTVSAVVHASERSIRSRHAIQKEQGEDLLVTRVARWFTAAFTPISPTFPFVLRRCLREQKPDVLHIHMPNLSPFWCLILPSARHIPWVVHWHSDVLASIHSHALRLLYRVYRPFEQVLLGRTERIIATSPPYLETSEPLTNHRDRCTVVPLGIRNAPIGATEVGGEGEPQRVLRVLFVGRLAYYKGLSYLVEAVASLERVELRVVGLGESADALQSLAFRTDAAHRIRFLGSLTDKELDSEIASADCLCLPSIERTEAFGVVLLEAMRAGKSVIATRVSGSGMSWVVRAQETGVLVDPESVSSLAAALARLRDDTAFRRELGVNGRARFADHFGIERIAKQVSEVYQLAEQM
ncbi:MAG: glycosyltransferase [Pseudomonadota bacterium]